MLDAYVIDEIRRREGNRDRDIRPTAEVPPPSPPAPAPPAPPAPEPGEGPGGDRDRGVVIIDYA